MTTQNLTERLKIWLNNSGHSKQWLASRLNVSERTISNWLYVAGVPKGKAAAVDMIINSSEYFGKTASIELHFTDEQMQLIKKKFSTQEEFELALKSFVLGSLYEKATEICRAHGLFFDDSGDMEAADSEQ